MARCEGQFWVRVSILCVFSLLLTTTAVELTSRGSEFFVAFPRQVSCCEEDITFSQKLVISNPANDDVTAYVTCPASLRDCTQNGVVTVTISPRSGRTVGVKCSAQVDSGSAVDRKGIFVNASGPVDVQVITKLHDSESGIYSEGGYMALPRDTLSTSYVIATHCTRDECFCLVVITEDNTNVTIRLRITGSNSVYFNSGSYTDGNLILTRGDAGDVIQVTCKTCDLSGSLVEASRNVAVLAGGQHSAVESGKKGDLLIEQMFPLNLVGTEYMVSMPVHSANAPKLVKVISIESEENTTFSLNGAQLELLVPTQVVSSLSPSVAVNGSVLLAGFVEPNGDFDGIMVLPLPISQWRSCYDLYVYGQGSTARVALVAQKNATSHLNITGPFAYSLVDNATYGDEYFLTTAILDPTPPNTGYLRLQVNPTCFNITPSSCKFSGYLYASKDNAAWSVPLISPCFAHNEGTLSTSAATAGQSDETTVQSDKTTVQSDKTTAPSMLSNINSTGQWSHSNASTAEQWSHLNATTAPSNLPSSPTTAPLPLSPTPGKETTPSLCSCRCPRFYNQTLNDRQNLATKIAAIQRDLALSTTELSQARRRKTSVSDMRTSAVSVGVTGIAILTSVPVLLLCCDLCSPRSFKRRDGTIKRKGGNGDQTSKLGKDTN